MQRTVWKRIRPILEPTVLQNKHERIHFQMRQIQDSRRAIIDTSYQEFKKTLMPSQWKYLPRTLDICALDPFTKVMDAAVDVAVTATDFEQAFCELPELLAASSDARKLHARSLLKILTSATQPAPEPREILQGHVAVSLNFSQPDALDLATAAFTCQGQSCRAPNLFGWDAIAQHHCRLDLDWFIGQPYGHLQQCVDHSPDPPKISFSSDLSKIAAAVVQATGLDDRVATILDMDAKDLRFGCSVCSPRKERGKGSSSWVKAGYKWRDFVRFLPLLFFFAGSMISSRSYIVLPNYIPQMSSSCSLQISQQSSKQAK